MADRPTFQIPDLPPGKFEARQPHQVSSSSLDTTLEKASVNWPGISRSEVEAALSTDWAADDSARALELLQYYFDACNGNVVSINTEKRAHSGSSSMLQQTFSLFSLSRALKSSKNQEQHGTENFGGVSCYIASTLTAMFSRLENFEPLLYQSFDDPKTDTLANWLRLFVNMLRNGELITKDIFRALLACAFELGWCNNSAQGPPTQQQDAGEFFSFLTDILHMPLLSLRVDIAHAGREVAEDDHKTVTEQLLFLPIPGGDRPILLEECLELYFSDEISVSRPCNKAERRPSGYTIDRRPTISSMASSYLTTSGSGAISGTPTSPDPTRSRRRSYSIVSQAPQPIARRLTEADDFLTPCESPSTPVPASSGPMSSSAGHGPSGSGGTSSAASHARRGSAAETLLPTYTQLFGDTTEVIDKKNQLWTNNNEITFPAWMFLQLMPFYAVSQDSDKLKNLEAQQVASHFEKTRPVLAMCLKRFGVDDKGEPVLNNRKVIIPHTIALPSFVADDTDMNQAFGNFKLVLESVVFHRGATNHSGHYTSMVREEFVAPSSTLSASVNSQKGLWRRKSKRAADRNSSSNNLTSNSSNSSASPAGTGASTDEDYQERWLMFDDQAPEADKVQVVDFASAMDNNMPYLLFYRMVSLDEPPLFTPRDRASFADALQLSPITSPSLSAPVSPRMPGRSSGGNSSTSAIPSLEITHPSISQPIHVPLGEQPQSQSIVSSAPTPMLPEEKKKKGKTGLFSRKHRDKEYARAYREEKCKVM